MLGPRSCQPYRAPPEPGTVLHTLRVISLIPLNQPLKEGFLLPILQKNRGSQKGNDSAKVTGPLECTKHVPPSWGGGREEPWSSSRSCRSASLTRKRELLACAGALPGLSEEAPAGSADVPETEVPCNACGGADASCVPGAVLGTHTLARQHSS